MEAAWRAGFGGFGGFGGVFMAQFTFTLHQTNSEPPAVAYIITHIRTPLLILPYSQWKLHSIRINPSPAFRPNADRDQGNEGTPTDEKTLSRNRNEEVKEKMDNQK